MGLYDVKCALSGRSSIGQTLVLVWVHDGRPVGPVLRGPSDRGGAIDGMRDRPHHKAQLAEIEALMASGRWDASKATSVERIRKHRPEANVLEAMSSAIASSLVGGGWPHVVDGTSVELLPVIAEIADAAARIDASGPDPLLTTTDPHELQIARGVLVIYGALGGTFPFRPVTEQLHIDDQEVFAQQRAVALERLKPWPALVRAVDDIRTR